MTTSRLFSLAFLLRAVPLLAVICSLTACDRYELVSRESSRAVDQARIAELEQNVTLLRSEIGALKSEVESDFPSALVNGAGRPTGTTGRYQFIAIPTEARSGYLLDTQYGVTWRLTTDPQTRKDLLVPVSFQGGFLVPTLHNEAGELVTIEKELETMKSLADVHQFVKQAELNNQDELDSFGMESKDKAVEAVVRPPAKARARLGRNQKPG